MARNGNIASNRPLTVPGLAAVAAVLLAAQPAAAEPRPVVLELFTSQGCNSCPPADELLGQLAGRSDVIALAYHIDYWDRLGWKDPFSSASATQRQYRYAKRMGSGSVYTPQMVVDGTDGMVGSDSGTIGHAIEKPRSGVAVSATRDDAGLKLAIGASPDAGSADIVVVAYSEKADTRVLRGENAGTVAHDFNIVRGYWTAGQWNGSAQTLRVDAAKIPAEASAVAVLLQAPGQGGILGATQLALR